MLSPNLGLYTSVAPEVYSPEDAGKKMLADHIPYGTREWSHLFPKGLISQCDPTLICNSPVSCIVNMVVSKVPIDLQAPF